MENATQFRVLELPADRMFNQKATKKNINEKMITVSREKISDAVLYFENRNGDLSETNEL